MAAIDRLIDSSKDIWEESYRHPFVQGIADGTLPEDKFRFYIIQDYLYLIDYAKVFAVGISKAHDVEIMRLFTKYIDDILNGEMDVHNGYTAQLGITREEIAKTPISLDSRSYTSYMLACAHEGDALDTLVAILSCAVSYEDIGKRIAAEHLDSVNHPVYGSWVSFYSSETYHKENLQLTEMLEHMAQGLSEERTCRLEEIFRTCSRYELSFWEMAWKKRI